MVFGHAISVRWFPVPKGQPDNSPEPECGRPRSQQRTDWRVAPGFSTRVWSATLLRPRMGALRQIVAFWSRPRHGTSRTLGVDTSPPGVAAKTLGVDSSPRGVAGRTCGVDALPRRVDGRIPGLCSAGRFCLCVGRIIFSGKQPRRSSRSRVEAFPHSCRQQAKGDKHNLACHKQHQPFESRVREPVAVQPDAEHVHAEP